MTGDDFGFSRGVNRAIIEAHERGVLTSASLMPNAAATSEAVDLARAHPGLSVGLHLTVVGGRAVLPFRQIPALVNREGRFPWGPVRTGLRYQFLPEARRQLRREIRAQLEAFRATGLRLSHVDGHLHMHMHPVVLDALADLSTPFEIPAVRLPREELRLTQELDPGGPRAKRLAWRAVFAALRGHALRRFAHTTVAHADRVYGLLATGRVTEEYLLALLARIDAETVEIYCHPAVEIADEPINGPPGAGPRELAALLSPRVRDAVRSATFRLSGCRGLGAASPGPPRTVTAGAASPSAR